MGKEKKRPGKNMFVHHVYFWLKNPDSREDLARLVEGLQKLSKVKTIKMFHIGRPADTNRDVIDRSYAVSWLLVFDGPEAQASYQTDPSTFSSSRNVPRSGRRWWSMIPWMPDQQLTSAMASGTSSGCRKTIFP